MIALDISTFFGRFHPLFVHLPIGFLLLAIIIEWYQGKNKASKDNNYVAFAWLLGALSAIIAAICGWLLANTGNYAEEDIFWHRWIGVVLAVVAGLGWWVKTKPQKFSKSVNNAIGMLVVGLLLIEGHLGGNLTHGANYLLEYAPESVQRLFGAEEQDTGLPQLLDKDSVQVYNDMIYPILEAKCTNCHNDDEQRGGLNMTQADLLIAGGENGPVVTPGNTQESELFRRVTLSQKNEKFMPPKGEPLTYNEIKVLEWWINNGADIAKPLPEHEIEPQMQTVLLKLYGLDTAPKPWYESVRIESADSLELVNLEQSGFTIKTLGQENPLLDVKFGGEEISQEQLGKLEAVSEHITWLSLAKTNVQDEWLAVVGQFPNLTRLQLEKTNISDAGLVHLSKLEHLEALNLYGTKITDSGLETLKEMPALKRVYIWGTLVSAAAAEQLQSDSEELEIIGGVAPN